MLRSKKYLLISFVFLLFLIGTTIHRSQDIDVLRIDTTEVNDIVQSIQTMWGKVDAGNLPGKEYRLDYVVVDHNGELIAATRSGLNTNPNSAIQNKDVILPITENDKILGYVIIYNNSVEEITQYRTKLYWLTVVSLLVFFLLSFAYGRYLDQSILNPFRKLKEFSHQISLGNLDIPLQMDKGNWFGSFTESFDIMRTEIYKARENERMANQSKKELVASLSHDIKTPIASIQSVCEVMTLKTDDDSQKQQLEVIRAKAEQMNELITNLFNATLEELQELRVKVTEESSKIVEDIIHKSDYNHLCSMTPIPECLILVDKIRLEQVLDNIISNSYKYAGTSIRVTSKIVDDYLEIDIKDFGKTIRNSEIPLLTNKYYRGENAKNKTGTGLGLYISHYLMNKMSGKLVVCSNDGFCVTLKIWIA